MVPARQQAVFEARQRFTVRRDDLLLLAATYWALGSKPDELDPTITQKRMGHACEWETSMILHLAPNLVGDLSAIEPVSMAMPFDPATQGWITKERTEPGHIGDPQRASALKGQALFRVFSHDVVTFLERVIAWDGRSGNG